MHQSEGSRTSSEPQKTGRRLPIQTAAEAGPESQAQMAVPVIRPGANRDQDARPSTCQREAQTWRRNNPEDKGGVGHPGRRLCAERAGPITPEREWVKSTSDRSGSQDIRHSTGTAWLAGWAQLLPLLSLRGRSQVIEQLVSFTAPKLPGMRDLDCFTISWKETMRTLNLGLCRRTLKTMEKLERYMRFGSG